MFKADIAWSMDITATEGCYSQADDPNCLRHTHDVVFLLVSLGQIGLGYENQIFTHPYPPFDFPFDRFDSWSVTSL